MSTTSGALATTRTLEEAGELIGQVVRRCQAAGRDDLAAGLRAAAAPLVAPGATVVVVGQAGRGKSSLVDALLGRPGLLPVGPAAGAAVPVVARHAPSPTVLVHLDGGRVVETTAGQLGRWAAADGVAWVEVGIDHPLLAGGLRLVDTPGVGDLDAAGAGRTLAMCARADALLFVTDASTPLTAPELAFLERAAGSTDLVLFALAKHELATSWAAVAAEDGALLAAAAPRWAGCPLVPVSAALAAEPDDRAASDLDDVAGWLGGIAARSRPARLAALARQAKAALAELPAEQGRGRGDAQARLVELREVERTWRRTLANGLELAALDLDDELHLGFAALARAFEDRTATWQPGLVDKVAAELVDEVKALAERIAERERDGVRQVVRTLAAQLGGGLPAGLVPLLAELDSAAPVAGGPPDVGQADQPAGALRWLLLANLGHGVAAGPLAQLLGLGARAGAVALAGPAVALAGPWGLAAGAVGGAVVARHLGGRERRARAQRQARDLVRRWLPEIKADLQRQLRRRRTLLRHELETAMDTIVAGRAATLRAAIERAPDHAAAVAELERRLDGLLAGLALSRGAEVAGTCDVVP
jgi:hypothetical protein